MDSRSIHSAFWNYVKKNKWAYIFVLFFTVLLTTQRILVPHIYGEIVNCLNSKDLTKAACLFFVLNITWVFYQSIGGISQWLEADLLPELHNYLREWLIRVTADSGTTDVDVGGMLNKLMRFPAALADYYDIIRDFVIQNCITIIMTIGYFFHIHWKLGTIFAGSLVFTILVGFIYTRRCSKLGEKSEKLIDESNDTLEDILSNLAAIVGADSKDKEYEYIKKVMSEVRKIQTIATRCQLPYRAAFVIMASLSLILMNYVSLELLKSNSIDIAKSVSVFIISYSSLSLIMQSYFSLRELLSTIGKLRLIDNFLKTLPNFITTKSVTDYILPPSIGVEEISMEFSKRKVANFTLPPGSRVCIKGAIGTGKSTMARMLSGLLEPTTGKIYLDKSESMATELRGAVYYVPQTPALFKRTLWENIIYGNEEKDLKPKEVLNILQVAGLEDIYLRFMENLDRNAGRRGQQFSGGERQIVWLLRATLSPQKIIILDEPTASLDIESRNKIEKLIKVISKGRTIIVITHDESLLKGWFDKLVWL